MPYVTSEHRGRYQLIEKAIQDFESLLDKNDSENGHIEQGQSDVYRRLINSLVVPNVSNGVLRLGRGALRQENYIPIWVLDTGEKYQIPKKCTVPTHSQIATATALLKLPKKITLPITNGSLSALTSPEAMPDYPAYTCNDTFPVQSSGHPAHGPTLYGRPRILLNLQHDGHASRSDALAHELQHVHQSLARPVERFATMGDLEDRLIADELEAYAHEGLAIYEMQRQGVWNDDANYHVFGVMEVIEASLLENESIYMTFEKIKKGLATAGLYLTFNNDYLSEERRAQPFTP